MTPPEPAPSPHPRRVDFTSIPSPAESPRDFGRRLAARLDREKLWVARHEVHGPLRDEPEFRAGLGAVDWPVHWVEGQGDARGGLAGCHVWAISGGTGETLSLDGRPVARLYTDSLGRNLVVGGLGPADASASRSDQADSVFTRLEELVGRAGMRPAGILRTWFTAADILDWYAPFNLVRTARFSRLGLRPFPTSTAVGGLVPGGASLLASAWVLDPAAGTSTAAVASPLQGPPSRYGSMFARATRIESPGSVDLVVSGTASIDTEGYTLHPRQAGPQVERMLRVLGALLEAEGFGWGEVCRATLYHRSPETRARFDEAVASRGLPPFPVLHGPAVICRDNLCCEMELDARRGASPPRPTG